MADTMAGTMAGDREKKKIQEINIKYKRICSTKNLGVVIFRRIANYGMINK